MLSYAGAGVSDQDVEGGQDKSLLQRSDLSWMLALMVVGLGLRLLYFSGFGLDDDQIFRGNIAFVLRGKSLTGDNVSYRLTWLLPSALSCKIFGLTELGMIFPITAIATLAIGLVYMFGKALWDTPGGIIAALLLIVHPLDVAWSTMLSNDITLSFFSTLSVFLMMRALQHEDPVWKCRLWVLGALSLWLAFQAKISAVFLAPAIAAICWTNRRRLGAQFTDFLVTVTMLFGATALVYYLFRGDPIAPYHAELRFQGLVGPEAIHHRLTAEWFWTYPKLLFFRDRLGDFLFSVYPHLLVGLALASWSLGIRTSREVFWWLLFVFLGMQFNVQRADGVWITGFRNVRHGHVLIHPLILLLTGYLVDLRSRHSKLCYAAFAVLLVFSAWQSVATASKTHAAFGDMRHACRFLAALPRKVIYSDGKLPTWCAIFNVQDGWKFKELHSFDREKRRAEIAGIASGYLVTGGGREPYYGCRDCIISAEEVPPGKWQLLRELPGPAKPSAWRAEPLRVWEAREVAGGVDESG